MAKNIERIADLLGAKIVAEVPDTGGGAFGAYRLAEIVARLRERDQAQPPGPSRPRSADWLQQCQLPISALAFRKLQVLAEQASTNERKVSPQEVAAELLEEAIARCSAD